MYETADVPLSAFLLTAMQAANAVDCPAFVTIIARTAEAANIQSQVAEDWCSLDDLTGDQILFLVPTGLRKMNDDDSAFFTGEGRQRRGIYITGASFNVSASERINKAIWRMKGDSLLRRYKNKKPKKNEVRDTYTEIASETARTLGLTEAAIPCLVMVSFWDRNVITIAADRNLSIYDFLKSVLVSYEPTRQQLSSLEDTIRGLVAEKKALEEELQCLGQQNVFCVNRETKRKERIVNDQSANRCILTKNLRLAAALVPSLTEPIDVLLELLEEPSSLPNELQEQAQSLIVSLEGERANESKNILKRIEFSLQKRVARDLRYRQELTSPGRFELNRRAHGERGSIMERHLCQIQREIRSCRERRNIHDRLITHAVLEVARRERYAIDVSKNAAHPGWTLVNISNGSLGLPSDSSTPGNAVMSSQESGILSIVAQTVNVYTGDHYQFSEVSGNINIKSHLKNIAQSFTSKDPPSSPYAKEIEGILGDLQDRLSHSWQSKQPENVARHSTIIARELLADTPNKEFLSTELNALNQAAIALGDAEVFRLAGRMMSLVESLPPASL